MSGMDDLLNADAARRAAMISADTESLSEHLADELIWTHSSGKTEAKPEVLSAISSGAVVYLELKTNAVTAARHGDIFLLQGTLTGRVSKEGTEKDLRNRFLSVWRLAEGRFQMLAWQSTGF